MGGRIAVGLCAVALALLGWAWFPGHAWLLSDTQIYVPMMEHIWDASTFGHDIVATKPHLDFTLYDEIAIALRWITHTGFHVVLVFQQIVFRIFQILGIYLLVRALGLSRAMALVAVAICSLGAAIAGPAVLTVEYEPIPRGYAVGLILFAIGLAARGRWTWASAAASVALLYHAPTTYPFWIVLLFVVLRNWNFKLLLPLAGAVVILLIASHFQAGETESQAFFYRIDAQFESIQRMRAPYNWVSTWVGRLAWQHFLFWCIGLLAFWRIRPATAREFLLGMPLIGVVSVPTSYILLEKLKWGFIPQFQPARALLWVTEFAIILAAVAAIQAVQRGKIAEAAAWLAVVFVIPMQSLLADLTRVQILLTVGLALALAASLRFHARPVGAALIVATVLAAYFLPPTVGRVHNYAHPDNTAVDDIARFAREKTPKDAMFLFPDAGSAPYPGIFRVHAQRAVYVDWKSGGQVNYYRSLAEEWLSRWQATSELRMRPGEFDSFAKLGIDYLVWKGPAPGVAPVYQNGSFAVYALAGHR